MQTFHALKTSVDPQKETKLLDLFDRMEKDLTYLGSSAIEDKLQEGVAQTIDNIMRAQVRVWVLTGDKQETAIEIGRACKLIQSHMEEVVLSSASKQEFAQKLEAQIKAKEGMGLGGDSAPLAIVIDG